MKRNKSKFYYATFIDKTPVLESGKVTGTYTLNYSDPILAKEVVGVNLGSTVLGEYGLSRNYRRAILDDDMLPITGESILWIDTLPVFVGEATSTVTPHDYAVSEVGTMRISDFKSYGCDRVNHG